jgi:hypothetical protein
MYINKKDFRTFKQYKIGENLVTIIGEEHRPDRQKSSDHKHQHIKIADILDYIKGKDTVVFLETEPNDTLEYILMTYNSHNVKKFASKIKKNKELKHFSIDIRRQIFGKLLDYLYYSRFITLDSFSKIYELFNFYTTKLLKFINDHIKSIDNKNKNEYLHNFLIELKGRLDYIISGVNYYKNKYKYKIDKDNKDNKDNKEE